MALFFLFASMEDYDKAFAAYLNFSKTGGSKAFGDLVEEAGLCSPFKEGALKNAAEKARALAKELHLKAGN